MTQVKRGKLPLLSRSELYRRDEQIAKCLNCGRSMISHWMWQGDRRVISREWR